MATALRILTLLALFLGGCGVVPSQCHYSQLQGGGECRIADSRMAEHCRDAMFSAYGASQYFKYCGK